MPRGRRLLGQLVLVLAGMAAGFVGAKLGLLSTRDAKASHNFSDVPDSAFYHDFVQFLVNNGITAGCGPDLFCGGQAVTRGQVAVFLKKLSDLNILNSANTALGKDALREHTTGSANTALGAFALAANTGGSQNTATGTDALAQNVTGCCNTATGAGALLDNIEGSYNIAVGRFALRHTTGSNNIGIGEEAGINATTGFHNIYVANPGGVGESGAIRIGTAGLQTATFIAGISGVNAGPGAASVVVSPLTGKLGTIASTKRVKEAIEDMGEASRGLLRLRPVTFRYRQPAEDGSQPRQYGLIAEEVAAVYPELVAYGADGEPSTVAYHLLPAMLLNELQRQAAELAGQQAQIAAQAAQLVTQEVRLRAQAQEMAALRALVEELRARSGTSPVTAAR